MRETALGLGLAAMAAGAALAGPLDGYRDRARVLVLSAPEAGDAQLPGSELGQAMQSTLIVKPARGGVQHSVEGRESLAHP
ncbi:hypothetical protein MOR12E_05760 [Methylobacterium oryzae]